MLIIGYPFQCNFSNDGSQNKNGSTIIRRTGSTHNGSAYTGGGGGGNAGVGVSRASMYFDDYVDEVVEDEDEEEASEGDSEEFGEDLDHFDSAAPSKERVFLRLATAATTSTSTPAAVTAQGVMRGLSPSALSTSGTAEYSTLEAVEEGHEHDHDDDRDEHDAGGHSSAGQASAASAEDQVRLEAGIVDYCVMLGTTFDSCRRYCMSSLIVLLCVWTGPAEPFSLLKPTHCITPSGSLINLPIPAVTPRTAATVAAQSNSASFTGLFSEGAGEEQEIVVWDRLPRHDHFDIEMPSKVCAVAACLSCVLLLNIIFLHLTVTG